MPSPAHDIATRNLDAICAGLMSQQLPGDIWSDIVFGGAQSMSCLNIIILLRTHLRTFNHRHLELGWGN
jgi:hypothetical protein